MTSESKHNTSVNHGLATDALVQSDYDMGSSKSWLLRSLNASEEWENRRTLFSCNLVIKFLTGRTITINVNNAMRIKDLNDRLMVNIAALRNNWPHDKIPLVRFCGQRLPAPSDERPGAWGRLLVVSEEPGIQVFKSALPPTNGASPGDRQ